jgi:two-component system, response regulator
MPDNGKRPVIVCADDDADDRMLVQDAFEEAGLNDYLQFVEDGEQLLDYLTHKNGFTAENAPRPDVILLDLNMPRKDGREALAEIKRDSSLRRIPVVILTTSKAMEDVSGSYDLGASGFITKPVSYEGLVDAARILRKYWFEVAELPSIRNGI